MITIVGEALIDLVIDPRGEVTAALGGAPFNTARACGRLGVDVSFVGALSDDRFGSMLRDQLVADGVDVAGAPVVSLPTTLAAAELDDRGTARYRFYIDGTSAPSIVSVPVLDGTDVVFTGGLALVLEPMATAVEAMIASPADPLADPATERRAGSTMVVVDVNCRPMVVADRERYVDRVRRVVGRSHIVKVSDEDLAYLSPGVDAVTAARELLASGPRVVLLTRGGDGVHVIAHTGESFVPVVPVEVVDTIGAGDTFGGALLAWLTLHDVALDDLDDLAVLGAAVRAANTAAGVACTRRGADPPRRADLPADWSGMRSGGST